MAAVLHHATGRDRFHRRTKVASKCPDMVAATPKLYRHYRDCPRKSRNPAWKNAIYL